MGEKLSITQQKIIEYIDSQNKKTGISPSVREIAHEINVSTGCVCKNLKKLEEMNYIKRVNATACRKIDRYIKIVSSVSDEQEPANFPSDTIIAPVLGNVAAGQPILAVENITQYIPLPSNYKKYNGELFALRVHGQSMVNAAILNNDLVIVRKMETAENGEIVVAMVDDSVTVKRFFKESNCTVRLQPENDSMGPIIVNCAKNRVYILGVVVGVMRTYDN